MRRRSTSPKSELSALKPTPKRKVIKPEVGPPITGTTAAPPKLTAIRPAPSIETPTANGVPAVNVPTVTDAEAPAVKRKATRFAPVVFLNKNILLKESSSKRRIEWFRPVVVANCGIIARKSTVQAPLAGIPKLDSEAPTISTPRVDAPGVPTGGKIGLDANGPCSSCGTAIRIVMSCAPTGKDNRTRVLTKATEAPPDSN